MTGCHTGNPYGALSDQIGEIIEVLVAEGTSPQSLYEAVHALYLPAADVETCRIGYEDFGFDGKVIEKALENTKEHMS